MIQLNVNGNPQQLDVEPDMPLLWALRGTLHLTGTEYSCGVALCGACMVHVDGAPVRSCVTPVSAVAGCRITTIEAVDQDRAPSVDDIDNALSGNLCRWGTYVRIRAVHEAAGPSPRRPR